MKSEQPAFLPSQYAQSFSQVCPYFQLKRTLRQVQGFYDQFFLPLGMTPSQFGMMLGLYQVTPIPIGIISQWHGIDRTTLTRNLKLLEFAGWACHQPGEDRRQKCWALTKAGEQKVEEAIPVWQEANKHFYEAYGDIESKSLIQQLIALRTAIPEALKPETILTTKRSTP